MVHRSYTHKHTNQPEIQTDTIKHKQTEVYTDCYTRKKDKQNKKKNYYNTKPRSHWCLAKTSLHLCIYLYVCGHAINVKSCYVGASECIVHRSLNAHTMLRPI